METSNMDISRKRNHQEEEQLPEHLECPRCGSSNTKFCYYNNYNKSQPRHFCKGCKRHWTKGGTLRNVPLGGGRKNKRQKPSNSATPKNISHVSSINNHTVPMTSSDDSLIFSKIGDTNDGMINNFIENDTFLGGDHGMFFLGSSHQDQTKQFSCSENGDFGSILPSFVPNIHSLDEYGYTQMPDSSFESTITTTMPVDGNNILSQKPWGVSFGSGSMDLSSLWDWNEINSLVSADLNIPWEEDAEIKF